MKKAKFVENEGLEYSSVQKAITILLSFIPDNKQAGTLQISDELGMNKSTVSRLIQVLMHYGLIQQDEQTRKYLLGRTCALLGMAVADPQIERLTELAQAHLEHLRNVVGESTCLEVVLSGRNKVIAEAIGPPPLSVSFMEFLPMHVTSGAKAILAHMDPKVVDSMIIGGFEKFTKNTITDPETFINQLKEIKTQGIAYNHGEANEDVHGVSVPVLNLQEKPIASVSICVPSNRASKIMNSKIIAELKDTAKRISTSLFPPITD